jgi:predicted NAD/FAD-binding protein
VVVGITQSDDIAFESIVDEPSIEEQHRLSAQLEEESTVDDPVHDIQPRPQRKF